MTDRTPLFSALERHLEQGRVSLHTPGHKGCAQILDRLRLSLDLTELPDTDSLYEADSAIAEAEKRATELYGSCRTVFSAGGCSLAIQAMLRCCCGEGDKIIMDRGCHRTAVNASALLGLEPVWLMASAGRGADDLCPLPTADDVKELLMRHADAKAVYITSPDYMGRMWDVAGISRLCREKDIPLLVDNAHGSHLIAFEGLHPLKQGATMTACSAHKTLPVLTGGAFLSCTDERYADKIKGAMALFGSTSPGYLIMASLDLCCAWLQEEGKERIRRTAEMCEEIRKVALRSGLGVPEGKCDPMRITLLTKPAGISGTSAADALRAMGFEPEYADDACVVLLPTPFVTDEEMTRLSECIAFLPEKAEAAENRTTMPPIGEIIDCAKEIEKEMPLRAAALARREIVPCHAAAGRIAAAGVCPCPPGVPIVMPGERISGRCVRLLLAMGVYSVECVTQA